MSDPKTIAQRTDRMIDRMLGGDRLRMQAHALDPGVFIRSMATRGSHGGLARATGDTITLLAAAGYAWVLVETVGVGQTELDIMKLADTTVVVLVPESGDAIQTMKEIGRAHV